MSLLDTLENHSTSRMRYHDCGGTILTSNGCDYCDRCHAFCRDGDFPTGTDERKNRAAWDNGNTRSPDAD